MKKRWISILLCAVMIFSAVLIDAENTVPEDDSETMTEPENSGAEELSDSQEPEGEDYTLTLICGQTDEILNTVQLAAGEKLESWIQEPGLPEGYEEGSLQFEGWYTADEDEMQSDAVMPEEDLTLYARWSPMLYTVEVYESHEAYEDGSEPLQETTVEYGTYVDEPEKPVRDGLFFDGWKAYTEDGSKSFDFDEPIRTDTVVYAVWSDIYTEAVIVHYIETDDGYEEYDSEIIEDAEIDIEYTAEPLDITGYILNEEKSTVSLVITEDECELALYYDRGEYPYEFHFLDWNTEEPLADPVCGTALFEDEVTCDAEKIYGYYPEGDKSKKIFIDAEEDNLDSNIAVFYYMENEVTIQYRLAGAEEGAELSDTEETLQLFSGEAEGSIPVVYDEYRFDGWYFDEACTDAVPEEWIASDNRLVPEKEYVPSFDEKPQYSDAVYYAKIIRNDTDLTICTDSAEESNDWQTYLFRVYGTDTYTDQIDFTVAVPDGRIVVTGLPVGEYTVTEISAWSWRYSPDKESRDITLQADGENTVVFDHERTLDNWLSGVAAFLKTWFET